jgi:type IV pilus assembly protein PilE
MKNRLPSLRRAAAGFTLIEMLVAASVASVLSSIAYPSFQGTLHKARRADALVALMQVQAAQERWRANHRAYGSLAEIGAPTTSSAGHYTLELLTADEDRYEVVAVATGSQAGDKACRHLKLTLDSATVTQASGADALVANAKAANRRCWSM